MPWRLVDGRWTADRPEVRVDAIPFPPLLFAGARTHKARDVDEFGATVGRAGCHVIKDNKRAQAHSDRCRVRIEECLRVTPQGQERSDRRSEVNNEALAEEIKTNSQRRREAAEVHEQHHHHKQQHQHHMN